MASSYLVGTPDEASCMRFEIYVLRAERGDDGDAREKKEQGALMAVDGINDGGDDASLLLAAARSHVVASCSSSSSKDYLWYRDSLLSSLRASTEEEAPWRKKKKEKTSHASAGSTSTASPSPSSSPPLPPCLWGELDFGDAVDDEWAAAWMLLGATADVFKVGAGGGRTQYRLAARCWDDDGDFLLIEAADALPRWLSPLNSGNRCWLSAGRVHLIPRRWRRKGEGAGGGGGGGDAKERLEQQQQPTLAEALEVLSRTCSSSISSPSSDAGPRVHVALAKRLGSPQTPPRALRRPLHSARALVPARLAALLLLLPSGEKTGGSSSSSTLVSAAVDAFYRRDPRGLRAASRARWFPPSNGAEKGDGDGAKKEGSSLVPLLVTTTRLQFAQLALQQYSPPAKGDEAWPCLPLGHRDTAAVELGAKLAAGFEILMMATATEEEDDNAPSSSSSFSSSSSPAPTALLLPSDPLSLDALDPPGWRDYLKALESRGAFDGELRGSARHQELRRQAAAGFSSSSSSSSPKGAAKPSPSPCGSTPGGGGGGGDSSPSPSPSSSSSSSSAASVAARRVAALLKDLGEEAIDAAALRAAGEAALAAAGGESSAGWLRAASGSDPASSGRGDSGSDDEFLAAISEAEAKQAAEAERKARKRAKGGGGGGGGGTAPMGDDGDDGCDKGKNNDDGAAGDDFDPASVVDRVKSFVEKMSSWEGAEAGASAAATAAAAAEEEDDDDDADAARFAGDREGLQLDEASFWDELGAALGMPLGGLEGGLNAAAAAAAAVSGEGDEEEEGSDDDDEGSSFYSEGSGSDEEDEEGEDPSRRLPRELLEAEAARLRALEEAGGNGARRGAPPPPSEEGEAWRSRFSFPAAAAADAAAELAKKKKPGKKGEEDDDDDDFAFATAYEAELGRQLRGTTLGQTWGGGGGGGGGGEGGGREEEEDDDDDEGNEEALPLRSAKRAATAATAVGGSSGIACLDSDSNNKNNPLAPVDVDVNLLESLLASYAGEAGIPGPASTLAGMLGVSLPAASSARGAGSSSSRRQQQQHPASLAPQTPSTSEKE